MIYLKTSSGSRTGYPNGVALSTTFEGVKLRLNFRQAIDAASLFRNQAM